MSKFTVSLPWPDWGMSPNSRIGWRAKAVLTKSARTEAFYLAREHELITAESLYAIWVFHEPDKRRRDLGNMLGACKAFQDGVFDALGLDDKIIEEDHSVRAEPRPWGGVVLTLYSSRDEFIKVISSGDRL